MEKLTHPVTVKFADDDVGALRLQAEAHGMEISEYIRHLVLQDREALRRQYATLNRIFGSSIEPGKVYRSPLGTTGIE